MMLRFFFFKENVDKNFIDQNSYLFKTYHLIMFINDKREYFDHIFTSHFDYFKYKKKKKIQVYFTVERWISSKMKILNKLKILNLTSVNCSWISSLNKITTLSSNISKKRRFTSII